jgi:hypothetical protein
MLTANLTPVVKTTNLNLQFSVSPRPTAPLVSLKTYCTMDLLVLDTAIPYKRMSTLKKHITDFGTFPHFILTCIKICFSLLLQYVCRFDVSQMSILKFEINSKV